MRQAKAGGAVETLVANAASPRVVELAGSGALIYADGVIDYLPGSVSGIYRRTTTGSIQPVVVGIAGRGPIAVTLTQLDSFGGGRPRSIHAKVQATPGLVDLHNEHERLMRRLGLPPETRKFAPHVTLARLKDSSALAVADYLSLRPLIRPLSFTASRFVLYSARDSVGGGPYVVEAAYPLDSRLSRAI